MTKVEVDLEDLETIVFATAAIKQIESALSTRKNDPFVKPYLQYSTAHSNLTSAMTHAKRSKETYATSWDGELSDKEIKYLQVLQLEVNTYHGDINIVTGQQRVANPEIDSLLAKGCIKMGTLVSGVIWTGDSQPTLNKLPEFGVVITPRGKTKLEEALMKRAEKMGLIDETLKVVGKNPYSDVARDGSRKCFPGD